MFLTIAFFWCLYGAMWSIADFYYFFKDEKDKPALSLYFFVLVIGALTWPVVQVIIRKEREERENKAFKRLVNIQKDLSDLKKNKLNFKSL